MSVVERKVGVYDDEKNKDTSYTDKDITIGTGKKTLKSSVLSSGLDMLPWDMSPLCTGDLSISVDAPLQDCVVDTMAPSAIQSWPATKEIRARVSVPFRLGINAGQDELDRVLEYAKQKIAMEIAEKLVASGEIQFDRQVMHEYEFGQDTLVLEGSLTVL